MKVNKKHNKNQTRRKKDKPPGARGEKDFLVLLWMMSHSQEDSDRRLFDEWSYNM